MIDQSPAFSVRPLKCTSDIFQRISRKNSTLPFHLTVGTGFAALRERNFAILVYFNLDTYLYQHLDSKNKIKTWSVYNTPHYKF